MIRDEFEKLFPVPHPAEWNKQLGCYSPAYQSDPALANLAVRVANSQNQLWQGFQSGHAAGLERAAAICDNADKSAHPADLADAIRAMKEQKK